MLEKPIKFIWELLKAALGILPAMLHIFWCVFIEVRRINKKYGSFDMIAVPLVIAAIKETLEESAKTYPKIGAICIFVLIVYLNRGIWMEV